MKQDVILVLDCGATNVRAMAVDRQGNIIARAATANASDIAAEKSDWHQWSLEAIMQRFADCCRQIHDQLASCTVRGHFQLMIGYSRAPFSSTSAPAAADSRRRRVCIQHPV